MPIGRAISWAFRRVRRAVRERPQGDEEAANEQERDEIKEGIAAILQCLRESSQPAAGPDPQCSGGLATTTPQASGGLATTTTTTTTTTITTIQPAEVQQIPSGHQTGPDPESSGGLTTTTTTTQPAGLQEISSSPGYKTAPEEQGQDRSSHHDEPDLANMTTRELVLLVLREAREIRREQRGTVFLFITKNNEPNNIPGRN